MRKLKPILLLFAGAAIALGLSTGIGRYLSPHEVACRRHRLATVPAPTGAPAAVLYQQTCRPPLGTTVELALLPDSLTPARGSGDIFSATVPRTAQLSGPALDSLFQIRWQSADTLVVWHAAIVRFSGQARVRGSVAVVFAPMGGA